MTRKSKNMTKNENNDYFARNADLIMGYSYYSIAVLIKNFNLTEAKNLFDLSYKRFRSLHDFEMSEQIKQERYDMQTHQNLDHSILISPDHPILNLALTLSTSSLLVMPTTL